MDVKGLSRRPVIHVGSTKNLRQVKKVTAKNPGVFWFEFTDDYSVFDYGKMPDTIPNKGAAAAMMTAHLFEKISAPATWKAFVKNDVLAKVKDKALRAELADSPVLKNLTKSGFPTHYQGIVNEDGQAVPVAKLKSPSRIVQVAAVRIVKPKIVNIAGRKLYDYSPIPASESNFLVPAECIFRFGVPTGSSLLRRLERNPAYGDEIGLTKAIKAGSMLPKPIVEFTSKLEPSDRFWTYEFALNASRLGAESFLKLQHGVLLMALCLREEFDRMGIKLWDGKFEFVHIGGALSLGDAITPDELRLTYKKLQVSKEPLRQYHLKHQPDFVAAVKKAAEMSVKDDRSLAAITKALGHPPVPIDPAMRQAASDMYAGITETLLGREVFGGTASLADVTKQLKKLGVS
ncbi:MAG: hypothetical protein H6684_15100 [Deltaproteobacteria bacterium]|nr:hypothetical protein [Deltaproteobacteria bacterium]MCB9490059.1 hypothetical protein [Deltaproteobacteria bacterium]